MSAPHGFALGVDLGTSNTVAVVRWPDGRTRPLLVDGVPVLPSGVYLDEQGRLHVGRDAQRLAQVEPARYEPNPKRRIDEGTVLLGDREIATVQMLAAVLDGVARAAMEAVGHLPPAVLTHPAAWGSRRREALAEAAARAGWPPPRLVPEPVGAARYFADVLRRPVPFGSSLAVFDFGGGTLDVAVVRNEGAHFAVLGSGGIVDLGGLDVDAALVDHLGRMIAQLRPDIWQGLVQPATTAQRRDRRLFWDDVRGAKEMLSRVAVAPVTVPGLDAAAHLTREELESVAAPLLRRAVLETGTVIRNCGLRPDELAGLFLVGGSSRLPLAARMLHAELGIAPTVLEQPELPVAEGALSELEPAGSASGPAGQAAGVAAAGLAAGQQAGPALAGQATTGYAPAPAGPGAEQGLYQRTGPIGPASPAPYLNSQPTSGTAPVSGGAYAPPAPYSPAGPSGLYGPPPAQYDPNAPFPAPGEFGPAGMEPRPTRSSRHTGQRARLTRRRLVLGCVAAAVVLLLLIGAGFWYFTRDTPVEFAALERADVTVPYGTDSPSKLASYTVDAVAYVVWAFDDKVRLAAIEPGSKKKLWEKEAPAEAKNWDGMFAGPDGIVLYPTNVSSSERESFYVFDPANGELRWQHELKTYDELTFFGPAVVVLSHDDAHAVYALDWAAGKEKWRLGDRPNDSNSTRRTATFAVGSPSAPNGPSTLVGSASQIVSGGATRLVQFDDESVMRVIDVATGKAREKAGVKIGDDPPLVAFGDKLYLVTGDSGYQVREYDLAKLGEPRVVLTNTDASRRISEPLARCGENRVCMLEQNGSGAEGNHVVAVDTKDGKLAWRKPAPKADRLIELGDGVVAVGESAGVLLFDGDGKQLLSADAKRSYPVRVDGSSVLLFSGASSGAANVALTGVNTDGKRTPLGSIEGVAVDGCSWNREYITCPIAEGFTAWRFAG